MLMRQTPTPDSIIEQHIWNSQYNDSTLMVLWGCHDIWTMNPGYSRVMEMWSSPRWPGLWNLIPGHSTIIDECEHSWMHHDLWNLEVWKSSMIGGTEFVVIPIDLWNW
jgi:hypothetical protein